MNQMAFRFQENKSIPQLSWVAILRFNEAEIQVVHGSGVETREGFFCDGVWADDFSNNRIDASFLAGSGGLIVDREARIVTADHTLEKIVAVRLSDRMIFSNSLVAALVTADDRLEPGNLYYQNFFQSFTRGIRKTAKNIKTAAGNTLLQFHHSVVCLNQSGISRCYEKQKSHQFQSFDDYFRHLHDVLEKLLRNATDPARKRSYDPIVALSGGYDSTAVAALASQFGCRKALVLQRTRSDGSKTVDVDRIGATFGLKITEVERSAHTASTQPVEAEFAACGYAAQDVGMVNWQPYLPGHLLLTGIHGDAVWSVHHKKPNTEIVRGDAAGASLLEFRSRLDFMHAPVPFIACRSAASIQKISKSSEMAPWSVGGLYDRPIARRIVESAGVQRGSFAVRKSGYIARFSDPFDASNNARGSLFMELSDGARTSLEEIKRDYPYRRAKMLETLASPMRFIEQKARQRESLILNLIASVIVTPLSLFFFARLPKYVLNSPYGWLPLLLPWSTKIIARRYASLRSIGNDI